jgi:hypothetical protein
VKRLDRNRWCLGLKFGVDLPDDGGSGRPADVRTGPKSLAPPFASIAFPGAHHYDFMFTMRDSPRHRNHSGGRGITMVEIAKCTLVVAVVAAGLGSASVAATTVRQAPGLDTRPAGATFVVSDIGRFRLSDHSGGATRLRPGDWKLQRANVESQRMVASGWQTYSSGSRVPPTVFALAARQDITAGELIGLGMTLRANRPERLQGILRKRGHARGIT